MAYSRLNHSGLSIHLSKEGYYGDPARARAVNSTPGSSETTREPTRCGADETLVDGVSQEGQEVVVEAVDV